MVPRNLRSIVCALGFVLMVSGVLSGCRFWESPEEQVVRLRAERREKLDTLYRQFRGIPEPGPAAVPGPVPPLSGDIEDMAEGMLENADRAIFEKNVSAVGRGELPLTILPEGRTFFERSDVRKSAQRIYEIEITIESTEKRLKAGL
ncbi:MAG: hypothetical protein IT350_15285 [Deltaproteobacteria bacterium]|nr:hypothetical protein [Deltaproteobacteria bacterium]